MSAQHQGERNGVPECIVAGGAAAPFGVSAPRQGMSAWFEREVLFVGLRRGIFLPARGFGPENQERASRRLKKGRDQVHDTTTLPGTKPPARDTYRIQASGASS